MMVVVQICRPGKIVMMKEWVPLLSPRNCFCVAKNLLLKHQCSTVSKQTPTVSKPWECIFNPEGLNFARIHSVLVSVFYSHAAHFLLDSPPHELVSLISLRFILSLQSVGHNHKKVMRIEKNSPVVLLRIYWLEMPHFARHQWWQ